jgi:hypothetical protein
MLHCHYAEAGAPPSGQNREPPLSSRHSETQTRRDPPVSSAIKMEPGHRTLNSTAAVTTRTTRAPHGVLAAPVFFFISCVVVVAARSWGGFVLVHSLAGSLACWWRPSHCRLAVLVRAGCMVKISVVLTALKVLLQTGLPYTCDPCNSIF